MPDTRAITARDGTNISYTTRGTGPGLIIVPGNNRMAHNYARLAKSLSGQFTVHTIERRGRGKSGPQGSNYSILSEVADLRLMMAATGAVNIFGTATGASLPFTRRALNPKSGSSSYTNPVFPSTVHWTCRGCLNLRPPSMLEIS
jgi:hypothetical protein